MCDDVLFDFTFFFTMYSFACLVFYIRLQITTNMRVIIMQWNLKNNNVLIPIVRFGVNKRIQGSREKVHVDSD